VPQFTLSPTTHKVTLRGVEKEMAERSGGTRLFSFLFRGRTSPMPLLKRAYLGEGRERGERK